ncbi:MAG: hypothetical protein NVSMB2_14980 [Chloroflexota bacterium]
MILLALLLCVVITLGAYAFWGEPYRPIFKRQRISVARPWPEDLSVLHISDLHVRSTDLRLWRVQKAALDRIPNPDLVCVTGDVCEKIQDIPLLVELLGIVRPRLGTYIVLGNHEHNAPLPMHLKNQQKRGWRRMLSHFIHVLAPAIRSDGPDEGHAMADALLEAGFTVLHNQGVRVRTADGSTVWIAGCDSAWAGHADMVSAMRGRRAEEPCLALIHEPDLAFEAESWGAALILAGHTHGGQVRLPFLGAPYTLRMDPRIVIASGFQRIESSLLHVTAGLGHTIPLRLGCPPEIVWLDCKPADSDVSDAPTALAA